MPKRNSLTRRDALALGLKGLGAAALGSALPALAAEGAPEGEAERPPNVLFIAVDDLRPQLGCYGHAQMISPHFDALAGQGFLFERAYCQQAVCAPSRASLMSGLRPDSSRVHNLATPLRQALPDVLTLPEHFKNNGYHTVSLGKIYHHKGRDDPQGWSEPEWGTKGSFPGYGLKETQDLQWQLWAEAGKPEPFYKVLGPAVEAGDVPDDDYADGRIAAKAVEDMERLKDQPFFLAVGFLKPHLAFAAPKRYWDLYERSAIDLADNPFRPEDAPGLAFHNWAELRAYHGIPKEGPLPDDMARELIHGYYACVSFIDAQVGRLMAGLDLLGLRENTVVILWGDHGWNLGEHGLWCKHCNFETSVHSPLIVSVPGAADSGRRTRALTEFVDVYPSLCELCGIPLPEHLEGTSFVPLLSDPDRPWKAAAFSEYPRGPIMGHTLRTDRYRYTEWRDKQGRPIERELYDHQVDPQENANVAAAAANAATVADLHAMMDKGWRGALPPA